MKNIITTIYHGKSFFQLFILSLKNLPAQKDDIFFTPPLKRTSEMLFFIANP